jgi:hypothetical protein
VQVTRCTLKKLNSSSKQRRRGRGGQKSAFAPKVQKGVSTGVDTDANRHPYFKKYRNERKILSLFRNYPLPNTFGRKERIIMREVYYCLPELFRLLRLDRDQLSLEAIKLALHDWLCLANTKRASDQRITRFNDWRRDRFSKPPARGGPSPIGEVRQSSIEPTSLFRSSVEAISTTGATQGSRSNFRVYRMTSSIHYRKKPAVPRYTRVRGT